jgi:hypothetical protein
VDIAGHGSSVSVWVAAEWLYERAAEWTYGSGGGVDVGGEAAEWK